MFLRYSGEQMVDWETAVLTGLFTGLGVETAKVIHDYWIKPRMDKAKQKIDNILKNGVKNESSTICESK